MSEKRRRAKRLLQLLTGIHRIHHIRFGYGWRLPLIGLAYFPAYVHRDVTRDAYGWRKVDPLHFHDCTATEVY